LIDPNGVIRYTWAGAPGPKAIDTAVEELLNETEKTGSRTPRALPAQQPSRDKHPHCSMKAPPQELDHGNQA
jgi:hypothetical protein